MKRFFLSLIMMACIGMGNVAVAQSDEYKKELHRLMESINTKETMRITLGQSFKAVSNKLELSEDENEELTNLILEAIYDDIEAKAVNVYYKELSLKELKEINKFYSSPTGSKLGQLSPKLSMGMIEMITDDEELIGKIQSTLLIYALAAKFKSQSGDDDKVQVKDADADEAIEVNIPE